VAIFEGMVEVKMPRLRSPVPFFGGKRNMVSKLLSYVQPHQIYVEPFGGGATLLLAKDPSPIEVYNDMNSELVNLFRVIRDPEKFKELHRLVSLTPYSREEFYYCRDTLEESKADIERAYKFFIKMRQGFAGTGSSWGYAVRETYHKMSGVVASYLSAIEQLPAIHQRLFRVQIEHDDFRKIIPRYDTPETFFYLDPPYIPATRKNGEYKYEMTEEDHKELVELLLKIQGFAMLSGYAHSIYEPLERAGWFRRDFKTACYAVAKTRNSGLQGEGACLTYQPRTETIWVKTKQKRLF